MKVLLWDNREQDRDQLARAVRAGGHEVTATGAIAEFRGLLNQEGWDIVVLDLLDTEEEAQERDVIKLSETTGYSLTKEVREKHPEVLIFLITRFRRVIEVGFEKLAPPVFLDSKLGPPGWLVSRMEQVHRLIREKENLAAHEKDLIDKLDESSTARRAAKDGGNRLLIAAMFLLLFLIALICALALPDEFSGSSLAKCLLVFGLAICGASGSAISDVFWPQGRGVATVVLLGAAAGAVLGLSYLLPTYQVAGSKFPSGNAVFVGSLVAFFVGAVSEVAMLKVLATGMGYVGNLRGKAPKALQEESE